MYYHLSKIICQHRVTTTVPDFCWFLDGDVSVDCPSYSATYMPQFYITQLDGSMDLTST